MLQPVCSDVLLYEIVFYVTSRRTAFCCWFLTMALITSVQRYLGCFSLLTGSCLLASNIIYAYIHNPTDLEIPFEDAVLTFRYGWCFHLCLVNGGSLFICVYAMFVVGHCVRVCMYVRACVRVSVFAWCSG